MLFGTLHLYHRAAFLLNTTECLSQTYSVLLALKEEEPTKINIISQRSVNKTLRGIPTQACEKERFIFPVSLEALLSAAVRKIHPTTSDDPG